MVYAVRYMSYVHTSNVVGHTPITTKLFRMKWENILKKSSERQSLCKTLCHSAVWHDSFLVAFQLNYICCLIFIGKSGKTTYTYREAILNSRSNENRLSEEMARK